MTHPLYAKFNCDEPDLDQMGLCEDCAKDRSLKQFVQQHSLEGPVCGVCRYINGPYKVSDPAYNPELTNLIKALIRFNYNEEDYNPHFGADHEPEELLAELNSIIETQRHLFRSRSPENIQDFLTNMLSGEPYPSFEEGIGLYAGFDDGIRMHNFAVKNIESPILQNLRRRLSHENHFLIEPAVNELIDRIAPRISATIPVNRRYFRARIGFEKRFQHGGLFKPQIVYMPFQRSQLGAPPPLLATSGRLNRSGVSFLYLASDSHTAAAEVRPHPGHQLSIGEFVIKTPLRVATFDQDITAFAQSDKDLELFHFIYSADLAMARPVTPQASSHYSITQLLADCLRQRGFHGVTFRSSVASGANLCVFDPESCEYVANTAIVRQVRALNYELTDTPMILQPTEDLREISA
jgi:RES domain